MNVATEATPPTATEPEMTPTLLDVDAGPSGPGRRPASGVSSWLHCAWAPILSLFHSRIALHESCTEAPARGSRPGVSNDTIPYWVGGITNVEGGITVLRGLFYGTDASPLLMGGDIVSSAGSAHLAT